MRLVINDRGAYVSRVGNRFRIKTRENEETTELSADKVSQILFAVQGALSTEAIALATDANIDIAFLDYRGIPYARVYPCKLGGTTLTRKKQAEATISDKSLSIARALVAGKCRNQAGLLRVLARDHNNDRMRKAAASISRIASQISKVAGDALAVRRSLLGMEGSAAAQYFQSLVGLLPFTGRNPDGEDDANICLNYGYGILYSQVEKACLIAGLDPFLGFYHADRYGKPCLVLDLVEEFRPVVVDRTVVSLFTLGRVSAGCFEHSGSRCLSKAGRRLVLEAVLERLRAEVNLHGRKTPYETIILEQARALGKYILEEENSYKAYVHRW